MKRKREAIEKQIMEGDTSDDEETVEDWKDLVRKNKKKKSSNIIQGAFDDL